MILLLIILLEFTLPSMCRKGTPSVPGEVGIVAFGGYHEAVQETVMLGCLLHVFWY